VSTSNASGSSFAYRVPANPDGGSLEEWAILVQKTRIRPGDVVELSSRETAPDGEVVIGGPAGLWEVIAVEPISDIGRPAASRRKGAGVAIWDGALILRRIET
jgi:hypothetical protein